MTLTKEVKVAAFMTAPRYCNTWARNIIDNGLKKAGIPLIVSGGVFYGQCMQMMLEDAISIGVEVALTVDFDSIFRPDQVTELVSVLLANEHIDAIASLQSRRGMAFPLFTNGSAQRVEFKGEPLQVATAHFGLTAIRLDRLKDIPKPWFHSRPDPNGQWAANKIDDDIWFWHQWKEHGRTLYIDSACSIGHLEEMIACFDENGNHQFMYPNDWYDRNLK